MWQKHHKNQPDHNYIIQIRYTKRLTKHAVIKYSVMKWLYMKSFFLEALKDSYDLSLWMYIQNEHIRELINTSWIMSRSAEQFNLDKKAKIGHTWPDVFLTKKCKELRRWPRICDCLHWGTALCTLLLVLLNKEVGHLYI